MSMVLTLNKNRAQQTTLRINGVLPDISRFVNEAGSERTAEVKRIAAPANVSCSIIFSTQQTASDLFHLLIDVGHGIVGSLQENSRSGLVSTEMSYLPDALLITHSHDDHVHDLPALVDLYSSSRRLKIFCTRETHKQLMNKFSPHKLDSLAQFIEIIPGEETKIGPFLVTPLSVVHYDYNSHSPLSGCVIYVVVLPDKKKIVIGWDFLTVNEVDQNLLWNPDVLILGAETYNHHPAAGIISVTEAFDFVRRWNAKDCYIVHYSGLMDSEDGKNQWFRGPVKSMTCIELQDTINNQLKLNGADGKFKMTVASEGMTWASTASTAETRIPPNEDMPIGRSLEIESLRNYILELMKLDADNKLSLVIEDRINRYALEFANPHTDQFADNILYGDPVKGMLARGPELKMEIISEPPDTSLIRVSIRKGKKDIFKDDISINRTDAMRLKKFMTENFTADLQNPREK
jgi:phosphoribosyl 1,2-cyclic phosphodiesterase